MSISTPVWTSTSFFPPPPPSLQFVPPLTARKEKRNAIRKPDKGGPRIFCKTEEISDGAARRILSWSRRPRQRIPGLGHPVYRYVPVLYLRRSHIWIGAHHIPPLPFYLSATTLYRYIVYGWNIAHVYLYYISRNIEWASSRTEMLCCRMSYSTSRMRAGLPIATISFIRNSDCYDFIRLATYYIK